MAHSSLSKNYKLPIINGTDVPTWESEFNRLSRMLDSILNDISNIGSSNTDSVNSINETVAEMQERLENLNEFYSNLNLAYSNQKEKIDEINEYLDEIKNLELSTKIEKISHDIENPSSTYVQSKNSDLIKLYKNIVDEITRLCIDINDTTYELCNNSTRATCNRLLSVTNNNTFTTYNVDNLNKYKYITCLLIKKEINATYSSITIPLPIFKQHLHGSNALFIYNPYDTAGNISHVCYKSDTEITCLVNNNIYQLDIYGVL